MTAIVGVLCEGGVVLGSDSAATFGGIGNISTIEQSVKKVEIVGNTMVLAGTGQVGMGQRFTDICKKSYEARAFAGKDHFFIAKKLTAQAINDFKLTGCQTGQFGALVAFSTGGDTHLCEFATKDFQPEFKTPEAPFCSMGSGLLITDPFLGFLKKVFFPDSLPNLQEGKFITTWALQQAIELNPGGVNAPIQIATISSEKSERSPSSKLLEPEEISEHLNNVSEAESHLRNYRDMLQGNGGLSAADVPTIENQQEPS